VVKLAAEAIDAVRRAEWQRLRRPDPERARWIKGARFLLRKAPAELDDPEHERLRGLRETNACLYEAWLMHDQLQEVFRCRDPKGAEALLGAWIIWAGESGMEPFRRLAATFGEYFEAIVAAARHQISNAGSRP
jgi:transposase